MTCAYTNKRCDHHSFFSQLLKLKHEGQAPPIEICPSSNYYTLGLKSYADHPQLRKLLALGYPVSINTDDRGIFGTSMTDELLHVSRAFGLSVADIVDIMGKRCDVMLFMSCLCCVVVVFDEFHSVVLFTLFFAGGDEKRLTYCTLLLFYDSTEHNT